MFRTLSLARPLLAILALSACQRPIPGAMDISEMTGRSIDAGSYEERIVLAVVNEADFDELDIDASLDSRAARNIVSHRQGADATDGTSDDNLFDDIAEVDAISYVGPAALASLLDYALSIYGEEVVEAATVHGVVEGSDEALAILSLVNGLSQDELDDDVALDSRAAKNIVTARSGADGVDGTGDDATIASLTALDAISYVGASAFDHLLDYAIDTGLLDDVVDEDGDGWTSDVDCDDQDAAVHPEAEEICDGVDDDCDASTSDEGLITTSEGITYDDLASAVAHTTTGETLLVCPGTYAGNLSLNRSLTLQSLTGADDTILDGEGVGPVVTISGTDVTLEGFTVTGGGTVSTSTNGGGIYQTSAAKNTSLVDMAITGNYGAYGGGLFASGTLSMTGGSLDGNKAASVGGGIYTNSTIELTDVQITGNKSQHGGGIYATSSASLTASTVEISGNTATGDGGGMVLSGPFTADGLDLSDNTGTNGAGAFLINNAASLTLTNSSILSNTATNTASGAVTVYGGKVVSTNSDWGKGTLDNSPSDFNFYTGTTYGWLGTGTDFSCSRTTSGTTSCDL